MLLSQNFKDINLFRKFKMDNFSINVNLYLFNKTNNKNISKCISIKFDPLLLKVLTLITISIAYKKKYFSYFN